MAQEQIAFFDTFDEAIRQFVKVNHGTFLPFPDGDNPISKKIKKSSMIVNQHNISKQIELIEIS